MLNTHTFFNYTLTKWGKKTVWLRSIHFGPTKTLSSQIDEKTREKMEKWVLDKIGPAASHVFLSLFFCFAFFSFQMSIYYLFIFVFFVYIFLYSSFAFFFLFYIIIFLSFYIFYVLVLILYFLKRFYFILFFEKEILGFWTFCAS